MSSPNLLEPLKNSTFEILPSASDAVALIVIVDPALKDELLAGAVILTMGGVFAVTEIATEDDVVAAPVLSVALAEIV